MSSLLLASCLPDAPREDANSLYYSFSDAPCGQDVSLQVLVDVKGKGKGYRNLLGKRGADVQGCNLGFTPDVGDY